MQKPPVVLVTLAALLAVSLTLLKIANGPQADWNARRLVGSLAFVQGYPLYRPHREVPVISGVNGPVQIMAYSPAAFFSDPRVAVSVGVVIAALFFLMPFLVLFWPGRGGWAGFLFWSVLLIIFQSDSFLDSCFMIHADAPALGLTGIGAILLMDPKKKGVTPWLGTFCLVLGVASKITVLPASAAILFYRFMTREKCGKYLWQLGISLAVTLSLFTFLFGATGIFDLSTGVALKSPWVKNLRPENRLFATGWLGHLVSLGWAFIDFLSLNPFLIVAVLCLVAMKVQERGTKNLKTVVASPSMVFLTIALFMVPTSLMARVKMGGSINNYSPMLYFFLLFLGVELNDWLTRSKVSQQWLSWVAGMLWVINLSLIYEYYWPLTQQDIPPDVTATRYLKTHPGKTYFPDHPLAHAISNREFVHSNTGVMEYSFAPLLKLTEAEVLRFTPKGMEQIAFNYGPPHSFMTYFPTYTKIVADAELPGWIVYSE